MSVNSIPAQSTSPEASKSLPARKPPKSPQASRTSNISNNNTTVNNNNNTSVNPLNASKASLPSARPPSAKRAQRVSSNLSEQSTVPDSGVENLIPLNLSRHQPIEKFFTQFHAQPANRKAEEGDDPEEEEQDQARNDNELLLEQFAEYTDDDSFFSSSEAVIEQDPNRVKKARRHVMVSTVQEALAHHTSKGGALRTDPYLEDISKKQTNDWLFQVHRRDIALEYSSFFVFPRRWTPRVVVYNVMHHWVMEFVIFWIIIGYGIFQATWARYPYTSKRQYNNLDQAGPYFMGRCVLYRYSGV
ncbi:hypothetical protein ADEAN_000441300 [Angomonas deanei]|uniref:Uncharacterized protein n=1 Tax=Angomonas deanei TaxID=59799 RepID=A0A7G2CBV4_9TRYP|nr:hypothetical protein ADEAN_000441300 [Angomonas deanei]